MRTQFEFGDSQLDYGLDGDRRHWRFRIDYADIPKRSGFALSSSAWLRRIGSLACTIGVLHAGWAAWNGASMLAGVVLGAGGIWSILLHLLSRKGFTVLKTDEGEIWIIRDGRHDHILSELRAKRRVHMLALRAGRVIPRALLGSASLRAPGA